MNMRTSIWIILLAATVLVEIALWHRRPLALVKIEPPKAPVLIAPVTSSRPVAPSASPPVSIQKAESTEAVSASIGCIVSGKDYEARLTAAHTLKEKLTGADIKALYSYLAQSSPADSGQPGQVLKNDVLTALVEMQPPPAGLRELLTGIYHDENQNIVLRDYAIQHLAAFYRQMGSASDLDANFRADELQQTQLVLWNAVNDKDSSIAGTALLGLAQLSQASWPGFDQNKIGEAALNLAGDGSAGELARISAFQVCAGLGVKDALSVVLGEAQQTASKPMQISAISALGALGGEAQRSFLAGVVQGDDQRLQLPAKHALAQIDQRLKELAQAK